MCRLIFADVRKNGRLFFGTFFAVVITTAIVCACLNLVFSAVASFNMGQRFGAAGTIIMKRQTIEIDYTEADGDKDSDSEEPGKRIMLTEKEADSIAAEYGGIEDYTFSASLPDLKAKKTAAHNISSAELAGFTIEGQEPGEGQAVIDEKLAEANGISAGDTISVDTNKRRLELRVSGIAYGVSDTDIQSYIFVSDRLARRAALGCNCVGFVKGDGAEEAAKKFGSEGYQVYTGNAVGNAELPDMSDKDSSLMIIFITMAGLCLVISIFVISGTVKFSVQNRFRTLALLRVIGFTKGNVRAYLTRQALVVSLAGAICGAFAGMPLAKFIIAAYERFGIVGGEFRVTHSFLWDAAVAGLIMTVAAAVTFFASKKPAGAPPAMALKQETDYTQRSSVGTVIAGLTLVAGGAAILIFTPMTKGICVGMAFCAGSVFLGGLMCLTPLIMKLFNAMLSVITRRLGKSLGQVASANISFKASKFAVAAVSIAIMMTMGTVMMLNNITYMNAELRENFEFAGGYGYVNRNVPEYSLGGDVLAVKHTKLVMRSGEKLKDMDALAIRGELPPSVELISGSADLKNGGCMLIADAHGNIKPGETVDIWLENGEKTSFRIGGIYRTHGITGESFGCIVPYDAIKGSLYDTSFDEVYSNAKTAGASVNDMSYYRDQPTFDIQLAAALLLGGIGFILSVIALFNTFSVIMSVRRKEFSGLKNIGASGPQIFKMTLIEVLIVTATGILLGTAVLVACVGAYSQANTGAFDCVVNGRIFYGTIAASAALGMAAGIIPSIVTIAGLKRRLRTE